MAYIPAASDAPSDWRRFSLSRRERAGVRGIRAPARPGSKTDLSPVKTAEAVLRRTNRPVTSLKRGVNENPNSLNWLHKLKAYLAPLLCLILLLAAGCRILVPPLPAANLKEPGWTVREGQAVWHLPKERAGREIAGEVLVATRPDGRAFVQFTKAPFPLVIAQAAPGRWEAEFPPQNRRYAGRGAPPKRLIWLYLPRVLEGQSPPNNWTWRQATNGWRLENPANGESLEGYFTQ